MSICVQLSVEELKTAKQQKEKLYQQADVRTVPDNDIDQVQQRVKGQAVRRGVRSAGHQDIHGI